MNYDHRDEYLRLAESALAASDAEETEVLISSGEHYLTRFASNVIHQNVGQRDASVTVRTVTDKRIGVAEVESLDPEAIQSALDTAQTIAAARPPMDDFKRLPSPGTIRPAEAFDADTAACSPDSRAEIVAQLVATAKRRRATAAGLVKTGATEIVVANSRGVRAYHRATGAEFQTVVTCGDGSGYAQENSFALGNVDVARVIRDGVSKATRSRKPRPIDAGEYDVVLEPAAVGIMLQMLGYVGFGGKAFAEGRSFMSGKIGQKVTGEAITIVDNAHDKRLRGMPFDFEGVPRKRVKLIDRGVAAGVVTDSYLAGRAKGRGRSTGHALPPQYASYGAMPGHLVMAGGADSLRSLVKSTQRGLLVTRFHYVNPADRIRTVLTGMTRDGTFWIEDGRISHPVRNLRFTESVIEALARCEGLSKQRRVVEGGVLCPAARIRGFRFTGTTGF